jgi:hypothetical protein
MFGFFKIVTLARNDSQAKRRKQERGKFHVRAVYLSNAVLTTLENRKSLIAHRTLLGYFYCGSKNPCHSPIPFSNQATAETHVATVPSRSRMTAQPVRQPPLHRLNPFTSFF